MTCPFANSKRLAFFMLCRLTLTQTDARLYSRPAFPRPWQSPQKSHSMRIHPLDLAIVIAYLLGVTALGIHFRRGQKDARDYFLGGRTAPWWALAFSIVATETSTLTIIGTPAISYGGNLTFLQL